AAWGSTPTPGLQRGPFLLGPTPRAYKGLAPRPAEGWCQRAGAWHDVRPARSASCPRELCPKSRLPPLSLRLAPSAGKPLANTVSECEANDQDDCTFQH